MRIVHDVYFTLADASAAARAKLVAQCHELLAPIPGVVSLLAGTRNPDLSRDVNDLDYDVSLHVVLADRAAHDAYQDAPAHREFIDNNQANWRKVRVFDSDVHEQ